MSAEREELCRLVNDLPDEQVPGALADVRRRLNPAPQRHWPPAWFAAANGRRSDTARRADEILAEDFGQRR